MAYLNLSAALKSSRASAFNAALGSGAYLMVYSGNYPIAPDVTVPASSLLAALPLSANPGTVTYTLEGASIGNAGSGGTNGAVMLTGTTGTGTPFQIAGTVSGGVLTALGAISVGGNYSILPTLTNCPVTGGGLTGATLNLEMTAQWTAAPVSTANATSNGVAGFGRLATSNTPGGAGLSDGDVGTAGTTFVINSTTIASGGPVICSSIVLTEV